MSELLQQETTQKTPEGMIAVENPATGTTIEFVENMSAARIDELVARARAAQPAWQALGFQGRRRLMLALRHWLVQNRSRVVDVVVAENGKTREDALLAELFYVADSMGFWAKNASKYLADEKVRTHSPLVLGRKVKVTYRPLGVVGVVAPWNYPLTLGFGDALPALMAGNSVIIKPSEITPLATQLMAEGAEEVGFPAGVFQVATGDGATGSALVDRADMIMFTGSTKTGRKIGARCGERLIPCSLELGGKDPMIVLDDADLERAANVAVEWGMRNSGQICMSVERVYVEAPVYDEFVQKVEAKVRALRQGTPEGFGSVDVGAITFPPQIDTIAAHVDDAVAKGARVLVGGKRGAGPGRFYEPTVLVDVDHTMDCMTEETFGPTLPIMKVADEDEGIRLANDAQYGLGSSVFSKDLARGERVARRINAGVGWVNDAIMSYMAQEAPFGGAGESGVGARHGSAGIRKYTQTHTLMVSRFVLRREPTMFPNTKLGAKVFDRLMVVMWGRKPRQR
ncbi:Aldehyde dehydrogenase [Patulibacter medicamentivorans]|uniref:Aldehyde dehydrogenase n=1 Tax=Patulibacter medicamentivorans TaxID=1097667 RepID=H0E975_9ACTN|nr:succinic semialdehyde dehydrogenase [Patulibacter medicamentivorans]EHN09750.1 Aldehyde dehydrogenase [Patulibacter medicamentivorans]